MLNLNKTYAGLAALCLTLLDPFIQHAHVFTTALSLAPENAKGGGYCCVTDRVLTVSSGAEHDENDAVKPCTSGSKLASIF